MPVFLSNTGLHSASDLKSSLVIFSNDLNLTSGNLKCVITRIIKSWFLEGSSYRLISEWLLCSVKHSSDWTFLFEKGKRLAWHFIFLFKKTNRLAVEFILGFNLNLTLFLCVGLIASVSMLPKWVPDWLWSECVSSNMRWAEPAFTNKRRHQNKNKKRAILVLVLSFFQFQVIIWTTNCWNCF